MSAFCCSIGCDGRRLCWAVALGFDFLANARLAFFFSWNSRLSASYREEIRGSWGPWLDDVCTAIYMLDESGPPVELLLLSRLINASTCCSNHLALATAAGKSTGNSPLSSVQDRPRSGALLASGSSKIRWCPPHAVVSITFSKLRLLVFAALAFICASAGDFGEPGPLLKLVKCYEPLGCSPES